MSSTLPPASPPAPRPPRQLQMVSAPKNPSDMEIEVYKQMAALFNSEESAFWTRNNILAVIHGGLLAATAGIVSNSEKTLAADAPHFAYTLLFAALTVLALVGLGMAVAWRFMVARGQRIADTISQKLKEIELELASRPTLNFPPVFHAFVHFGERLTTPPPGTDPASQRYSEVRLAKIWGRVGQFLMWLWASLALVFFLLLVTGYARPPQLTPPASGAAAADGAGAASCQAAAAAALQSASAAQMAATKALQAAQAAQQAAQQGTQQPIQPAVSGTQPSPGSCTPCAAGRPASAGFEAATPASIPAAVPAAVPAVPPAGTGRPHRAVGSTPRRAGEHPCTCPSAAPRPASGVAG